MTTLDEDQKPARMRDELSDIRNADTTKLAYIGDAVYEVFIRMRSAEACGRHARDMNKYTVHYVRADSQAKAARGLLAKGLLERCADAVKSTDIEGTEADIRKGVFTDDEEILFRRARNRTNTAHPRGCTPAEYKLATGFEAVIGWLYITGDRKRLAEIVNAAIFIIGA